MGGETVEDENIPTRLSIAGIKGFPENLRG